MPPGPLAVAGITAGVSGLFNLLGGQAEAGRRKKLQQQLMELLSPERLGAETNSLFDLFRRSPMYTGLRTGAMESSSQLGNQLQTSFARRGLSQSGIAATALPIARASHLGGFRDIDSNLFIQALSQARQGLQSRANVLTGTSGPSGLSLGAGNWMQSMMPLLLKYFESKFPTKGTT